MKDAMAKLMGDSAFAHRLGKAAEKSAEKYKSDAVVRRWREVIEG